MRDGRRIPVSSGLALLSQGFDPASLVSSALAPQLTSKDLEVS